MNSAGAIHDFEIATAGKTSEDVAAQLPRGLFGFADETGTGRGLGQGPTDDRGTGDLGRRRDRHGLAGLRAAREDQSHGDQG